MSLRVLSIVTILLVAPLAATARAHWLNDLERWVGVGTSDGYHARTGCPPKRSHFGSQPPGHFPATWSSSSPSRSLPPTARAANPAASRSR